MFRGCVVEFATRKLDILARSLGKSRALGFFSRPVTSSFRIPAALCFRSLVKLYFQTYLLHFKRLQFAVHIPTVCQPVATNPHKPESTYKEKRSASRSHKMPSVPTPSKSGIIESNNGERHIPSSLRPDGTKRREIKIRPGYKPPEDVEVYKNRTADAFRNRGNSGVPGAEGLKDDKEGSTVNSNKNAKRREARKKAKATEEAEGTEKTNLVTKDKQEEKSEEVVDPAAEREKKARNLKKKLKQAKELKEKKDGGVALLPEQLAKVIKISELIRELDALGFDAEGEPKPGNGGES